MKIYKIKVNGKTYKVELESIDERVTKEEVKPVKKEEVKKEENAPTSSASGDKKIVAPLQGVLLDIKVKVGDKVKKGDTVAIIEAMKLENEVSAPFDGEVVEIKAQKGSSVSNNDLLMVLK